MSIRSEVKDMSCQLEVKSKRCHANYKGSQRDVMSIRSEIKEIAPY